jgi:thioredoxin 1
MNVDENVQYPQEYGIMSIPTVMLFKDGQVVETMIGLQPKEEIVKTIQEHL